MELSIHVSGKGRGMSASDSRGVGPVLGEEIKNDLCHCHVGYPVNLKRPVPEPRTVTPRAKRATSP